jgi:5-methylcytosine-specific restriction protein A
MPELFEIGRKYRRRDLHAKYGGQAQRGIITPRSWPIIMLVTGNSGVAHGYLDEWIDEGMFRYFGEGRSGDMTFTGGNKAIRDHVADGRDLHVFRAVGRGMVEYIGQMTSSGFEYVENVPGSDGLPRRAIAFLLVREGAFDRPSPEIDQAIVELEHASLEELRRIASAPVGRSVVPTELRRWVYKRSRALRMYVLGRAAGKCEGCGQNAPFAGNDGRPFLEAHHTRRLSDGGPDHPRWVTALCPNCHRRAHYSNDSRSFNEHLMAQLAALESRAA